MTELAPAPAAFPTAACSFALPGPAGVLEVAVDVPEPGEARRGVAIVCHPLPTEGGTMHNKVVTITERSLRELGLSTVRFNFRGVGASTGAWDNGRGEALDLQAVAAWVAKAAPDAELWLAGFSFGAYVALLGARHLPARQLIAIAPPAGRWDFAAVLPPACPWLVVQGEADEIVDPAAVYAWVESLEPRPTLVRMPEADHFFHRRLMDLRGLIKNGVRRQLPPPVQG